MRTEDNRVPAEPSSEIHYRPGIPFDGDHVAYLQTLRRSVAVALIAGENRSVLPSALAIPCSTAHRTGTAPAAAGPSGAAHRSDTPARGSPAARRTNASTRRVDGRSGPALARMAAHARNASGPQSQPASSASAIALWRRFKRSASRSGSAPPGFPCGCRCGKMRVISEGASNPLLFDPAVLLTPPKSSVCVEPED